MVSFEEILDADDGDGDSSWMELMGKDLIMKVRAGHVVQGNDQFSPFLTNQAPVSYILTYFDLFHIYYR